MFSIIIPGRPCQTDMHTLSPTQFAFTFPLQTTFSHIVVFIIPAPGNVLPPDTAAAVYLQFPGEAQFRFLGALANEKPSAVFKVNLPANLVAALNGGGAGGEMVSLGISVEGVAGVQGQMARLQAGRGGHDATAAAGGGSGAMGGSMALTTTTGRPRQQPSTKVLAQRIIKNAFNFLASFAGGQGGQEVVPLKSFEEWWRKFERRVENDPTFLERDED